MCPALPTISFFLLGSYFSLLFLENVLLSLLFTLKYCLCDKNAKHFLSRFTRLDFKTSFIFFPGADN